MMVREEFLERAGRRAVGEQERDLSRAMAPVPTLAGDSAAGRSTVSPVLTELERLREVPRRVQPWQVAARAKGRPGYFLAKRCLDVVLAVLALLIFSPLFLAAALLVRLTSRGPAFFHQERVGYKGQHFTIYKFRSMYEDSDDRLHRAAYKQFLRGERSNGKVDHDVLVQEQAAQSAAAPRRRHFWTPDDPRVTPLGHLLRQSSIDELPQLLNVLKGEMSLVGPRPPIPYEVGLYEPRHMVRLDTLPGITGPWQVHGRSRVSFEQMVEMDRDYIQKQSFWYDVKLLFLTIPAVLSHKGAG